MATDKKNHIQIKNINQGGIADSDYLGALNSVAEIVGINIHDESGIMKLNQKLTRVTDTASAVDTLVKAIVSASNGSRYFFGANGKVWKLTSGGTWSLLFTASPAAGAAGILGAREYQGYIYYAMQSRLGRFDIATETKADNWATFTNTNATYHPMAEVNQVLYIGDGRYVSQVDAGTFSANALDIQTPLVVSALGKVGTDLLIGTYVSSNVVGTQIFRWNTWSDSYSVSDEIPEVGINAFLSTDNRIVVSAGTKGNLYVFNGSQLDEYKQIKGTWGSSTNKAIVNPNAVCNFHGLPLFGLSQQTGTGVNLGVYSFGRTNANYPYVLALEYPISTGHLTDIQIGAIEGDGDTFFVSWYDSASGGSYGVDQLDLTAKYTSGWISTRVSLFDRIVTSTYGFLSAAYRTMPTGTSVKMYSKRNHGSYVEKTDVVVDTDRLIAQTKTIAGEANAFQAKFELIGSGNDSPEIELFDIPVT